MTRKIIVAAAALLVTGGGLALYVLRFGLGCAGTIVEDPQDRLTRPEEIKAALKGDDFRLKNQARQQLGTLAPADQVSVLEELLAEGDAPTRLLAVAELASLPAGTYAPILRPVAQRDPDPEVREFAAAVLGEEPPVEALPPAPPPQ